MKRQHVTDALGPLGGVAQEAPQLDHPSWLPAAECGNPAETPESAASPIEKRGAPGERLSGGRGRPISSAVMPRWSTTERDAERERVVVVARRGPSFAHEQQHGVVPALVRKRGEALFVIGEQHHVRPSCAGRAAARMCRERCPFRLNGFEWRWDDAGEGRGAARGR